MMAQTISTSLTTPNKKVIYRRQGFAPGGPLMDKAFERLAGSAGAHGSSANAPSKGFQNLIKGIAESKTKHEEERIIRSEALFLKDRIGDPDITGRQMRELLIRVLYCEMLGVDCSWGYIHAVKLTQKGSIMEKRIGYLTASLCLHEGNELNVLLVNTLQKDLKSSNILEVSMAMSVICKLVGKEMIPAFMPLIQEKLVHPKELIRKKALMVIHRFHHLSPSSVSHLHSDIRRCLSDTDPGVMDTCLVVLYEIIKENPAQHKNLTSGLVHILNQVIGRKLPNDFDYHTVPAPWTQMKLLQLLSLLGADDQRTSGVMYQSLADTLASAECTSNIGQAITYECIKTITSIHHDPSLVKKAAHAIGRFLNSSNNNWKCLGVTALGLLVQMDTSYTIEHQLVVIDCLDDPDDTLKRKTLDLLFKMTNSANVVVIAEKLVTYLKSTRDEYIKSDLVSKITQLAERYAPDNHWFIRTMNEVFELGGRLVRNEVAHNLMRLIAEGTEDESTDMELRQEAVLCYLELMDKPTLPDILVKIVSWVVGEYSYLCEDVSSEETLDKMVSLLGRKFSDADTLSWVITAVTKLVSQMGTFPDHAQSHIACYLASNNTDTQQRCSELTEMCQDVPFMQQVLPVDASCEDFEVDPTLSFLDDYVSEALERGASPYKPAHMRTAELHQTKEPAVDPPSSSEIKFTPYERPSTQPVYQLPPSATSYQDNSTAGASPVPSVAHVSDSIPIRRTEPSQDDNTYPASESPRLPVRGARVWGSSGYSKRPSLPVPPVETAVALPTTSGDDPDNSRISSDDHGEPVERDRMVVTTTAPSTVTAVPVMSAEEAKKRELASALFGGGGGLNREGMLTGGSKSPRSGRQKRGSVPMDSATKLSSSPTAFTRKPSAPLLSDTDLLLDLDFGATPSSLPPGVTNDIVHPHPSSVTVGDAMAATTTTQGLFGSLDVRPPQPVATAPTPAAGLLGNNTLGDLSSLFGGPVVDNNRSTVPQVAASTSTNLLTANNTGTGHMMGLGGGATGDAFGSLLDTPPQPAPPPRGEEQPLAISLFESSLSELGIPAELERYPAAPNGKNVELCCDDSLRVTVTKVMKPNELVLVVFLTNQKQINLVDVTTSIDASSNLKCSLASPTPDNSNSFLDQLSSFATSRHVCTILPVSPGHNMNLHGKITYKWNTSTRRLFFDLSIHNVDLMRPLEIDTDSFGKKWSSFKNEKRHKKVSSHVKTPEMFMDVIRTKLNFHPIQIIGKEAIAAGTFLPSTLCLLHGKLSASSGLDVWIKSGNGVLTESFSKEVLSVLGAS